MLWRWSAGLELLLVLAVSAVVLVPGIGFPGLGELPVVDRDEARFAQASRQMLESGTLEGWIVPRVGDRPRLNKPPLIYWLQAGSAGIFTGGDATRDHLWMYRLPSVLAALCAAGLTWWMGRRAFGSSVGVLAGLLLGTCPLVVFDAHQARADEVLLLMTLGAQVSLWWCWRMRDRLGGPPLGATILMWVFVGLGIMTKGPITPFVLGATALTLAIVDRRFKWLWHLRPLLGIVIVTAIVGPWLALLVRTVGWDAVKTFLDEEVVRRASTGVEGHWGPPGYHLVLLVMLFWPGSLLAAAAVLRGIRHGTKSKSTGEGGRIRQMTRWLAGLRSGRDTEFYLIAWLLPSWIVFEIAGTKLPHYVLPLYPALALLVARALVAGIAALPEAQGKLARFGFAFWLVLGIGLALAPAILVVIAEVKDLWHLDDAKSAWWPLATTSPTLVIWMAVFGGVLAIAAVVIGFVRLSQGVAHQAIAWALATAVIAQVLLIGFILPRISHIWISPRLLALIEHDSGEVPSSPAFPPIAAQGFGEDSLVFLSRGKIKLVGNATEFLTENDAAYAIVPESKVKEIQSHTGARVVGEVHGFDYADGDAYELAVLTTRKLN